MDKLYPINGLFFYKLIFMALLILGEAIFCYKLAKKDHFAIRLTIGIIACFIFALAFPIPTSNDFYFVFGNLWRIPGSSFSEPGSQ